jgi:DNA-binding winged helix-turn-helix (wHTH) protein/TolB-like protein/Tfp pilus assembly protein PilF
MSKPAVSSYEFGPFQLDAARRRLLRDGQVVALTPKAFELLLALVENRQRVLDKSELMERLWPDSFVEETNLTQNISTLRKALGESPQQHHYIVTVPGRGYRFVAEVRGPIEESLELLAHTVTRSRIVVDEVAETDQVKDTSSELMPVAGLTIRHRSALIWLLLLILVISSIVALLWLSNGRKSEPTIASVKSIAVLPFKPIDQEKRDAYFELGMADALITKLSGLREIIVRPTTSVRKYADVEQDAVAAGRELQVEAVLVGSTQRLDDRVRVTVQLINVSDGRPLWAYKCDDYCTDIFTSQDTISERVSAVLELQLTGEERQRLVKRYTANTDAYLLYQQGRFWWGKRTEEGLRKSKDYLEQAIQKDPGYALAYAGLADTYGSLSEHGFLEPHEAAAKGRAAVAKALAIDDQLAEAHASLAGELCYLDRDFAKAEPEYKRAIELNTNYAMAHYFYGSFLSLTGRHTQAIEEKRRARELEPTSSLTSWGVGWALYNARQYDEAIEAFRQTIQMDPSYGLALKFLGQSYLQKHIVDQAIAALQEAVKLDPAHTGCMASLGYAYAMAGKRTEAHQILEKLKELEARRQVEQPYHLAILYTGLGDKDQALLYLERTFEKDPEFLVYIKVEPLLDSLRSDPRFEDMLRRLGLA